MVEVGGLRGGLAGVGNCNARAVVDLIKMVLLQLCRFRIEYDPGVCQANDAIGKPPGVLQLVQ